MVDTTLFGLLQQIDHDNIVLPTMQRPFIWDEERIYRFIDSLLRGLPIGAVMLWKASTIQSFRRFPRDLDTEVAEIFNYETLTGAGNKYVVLDGQQRLTSLFVAFKGTYNYKRLYIDVLSGSRKGKDPGNKCYDCRFLSEEDAVSQSTAHSGWRRYFMPMQDLVKIDPAHAAQTACVKAQELELTEEQVERMTDSFIRCAAIGNSMSLPVITIDAPIEKFLEVFQAKSDANIPLSKSDLLMCRLGLVWSDIIPALRRLVEEINENRPFGFTRDDVLKSLLLVEGTEARFDILVSDPKQVEQLAKKLPAYFPAIKKAWQRLGSILYDNRHLFSERFLQENHSSLLPFVLFLSRDEYSNKDRWRIEHGIRLALLSGVFNGAESRMSAFAINVVAGSLSFPFGDLILLVKSECGITSVDSLLMRNLDFTLTVAHGGITPDKSFGELRKDYIFPKSQLEKTGYTYDIINHYANFHFLRDKDSRNKLDKPPHEWFRNPGINMPPYSDKELERRLLRWDDLQPGNFESMIKRRGKLIRSMVSLLLGIELNVLLADVCLDG